MRIFLIGQRSGRAHDEAITFWTRTVVSDLARVVPTSVTGQIRPFPASCGTSALVLGAELINSPRKVSEVPEPDVRLLRADNILSVRTFKQIAHNLQMISIDRVAVGPEPRGHEETSTSVTNRLGSSSLYRPMRSEHLEDVVTWTDGGPPAAGNDNQRVEASQLGRCRLEGA